MTIYGKTTRISVTSFDEALEAAENIPSERPRADPIGDILARRYPRRAVVKGGLAASVIAALANPLLRAAEAAGSARPAFDVRGTVHGVSAEPAISPDHDFQVLLRWGDPLFPDAPAFDPANQSAAAQARQFGYNNDHIAFFPLPTGSQTGAHGLLCVNHEYTSPGMMFSGLGHYRDEGFLDRVTRHHAEIEMAAHGASIVEVRRDGGGIWEVVKPSPYTRRITANGTIMRISGPAAGHRRLRTRADPSGKRVVGTINNCAGGTTPWGTYLMAEENFNFYFAGEVERHVEARNYTRLGIGLYGLYYAWGRFHDRFDIAREPNEPNRFGWIVEVDPYDRTSVPVKRTALGRFKHEGAETLVNQKDRRLVVYMGDDQKFDYVYRFVSKDPVHDDPAKNRDLLDKGTLSVARFDETSVTWLPLVHGYGPLIAANDFHSQADVLIETRRAADLLGATPMDRPEDVQPSPASGSVYVLLTNNTDRAEGGENAANRRPKNKYGHIIELRPPGGDHTADTYAWDMLVQCGPYGLDGSSWNALTNHGSGWFAAPDNCAVDGHGRLWVATDQGDKFPRTDTADGIWGLETEGARRASAHMLFRAPVGAEVTGPYFTPDNQTLFAAVQHPGADLKNDYTDPRTGAMFRGKPTFDAPATRWPDFMDGMPPRPSVLAIRRKDGGQIG